MIHANYLLQTLPHTEQIQSFTWSLYGDYIHTVMYVYTMLSVLPVVKLCSNQCISWTWKK